MTKRILVLLGHPDPRPERFCAALARAYVDAAREAGHAVREVDLAQLDAPLLANAAQFAAPDIPSQIGALRDDILWAQHVVLIFPLWLGAPPAKLKALLEQVFRAEFGFAVHARGWRSNLTGRSIRLVTTMATPTAVFWMAFGGHGLLALQRSVFWPAGFKPIRKTVIGGVEAIGGGGRLAWLARMRRWGAEAR